LISFKNPVLALSTENFGLVQRITHSSTRSRCLCVPNHAIRIFGNSERRETFWLLKAWTSRIGCWVAGAHCGVQMSYVKKPTFNSPWPVGPLYTPIATRREDVEAVRKVKTSASTSAVKTSLKEFIRSKPTSPWTVGPMLQNSCALHRFIDFILCFVRRDLLLWTPLMRRTQNAVLFPNADLRSLVREKKSSSRNLGRVEGVNSRGIGHSTSTCDS